MTILLASTVLAVCHDSSAIVGCEDDRRAVKINNMIKIPRLFCDV